MKTSKFLILITSLAFAFSSCSTEENLTVQDKSPQLLKSFKVKKDVSGKYYLDFDLNDGTKVDEVYDAASETNQIYLYSSNGVSERKVTKEFGINNSKLKIGFVDTNTDKKPSITILDDDIAFAKNNSNMLSSYSIEKNDDGTYQLDFSVAKGVNVDFVYNEANETYEVHLQRGKSNGSDFSRNFIKEEDKALKIDFVNHSNNRAKSELYEAPRKPRVVIDTFSEF